MTTFKFYINVPKLVNSNIKYSISVTPIVKALEPKKCGWRWSKWGHI